MGKNKTISDNSNSWATSFGGAAIFILWGIVLISFEIPHEWALPAWMQTILFIGLIALLPIGTYIGWIKNFPRWSYPYVGHVLVFSLYLSRGSTPGIYLFGIPIFDREIWGWRAWIPFALIATLALVVTRSSRPIARFFTNILNDWTLLTFGMFGFMPLLVFISFDEVDRLYTLYFMVVLSLLMTGVALLYMRADNPRNRVIALLTGIVLTIAISVIAPSIYWQRSGWTFPLQGAILGGIVLLFMFSPAVIGLLNRAFTRPDTV